IERQEAHAVGPRNVFPVARSTADQTLRIVGPEFEGAGALTVGRVVRTDGFAFALDTKSRSDAGGIEKSLRRLGVRACEVFDLAETQIPLLMKFRRLGELPDAIEGRADIDLTADAARHVAHG